MKGRAGDSGQDGLPVSYCFENEGVFKRVESSCAYEHLLAQFI